MRVILISFDALEDVLVKRFGCNVLMQKEHGIIDLEPYFQGRRQGPAGREPLTPEVYLAFMTGKVEKNLYHQQQGIINDTIETIFSISRRELDGNGVGQKGALAIDVPAYSKQQPSFMTLLTGVALFRRYWKANMPLTEVEAEYFKYADFKASYAKLVNILNFDLVCWYFAFTDKLGHIYTSYDFKTKNRGVNQDNKLQVMYQKAEEIASHIIKEFDDGKTLIIIFSDHGLNLRGGHSSYGFWSSNKPLGRGNKIKVTDWFELIKKWYNEKV